MKGKQYHYQYNVYIFKTELTLVAVCKLKEKALAIKRALLWETQYIPIVKRERVYSDKYYEFLSNIGQIAMVRYLNER